MGIKSVEKLKEEVSKRKDIPEGEKGSLMEKIRKLEQETDELLVQIGSVKMGINSFKKLKGEVSKRKDIPKEKKGSLMEKIRKLKQEKGSVKMEIKEVNKRKEEVNKRKDIPKEEKDRVQEVEEMSDIVDKGKDNTKSGKEKHNEEELQTLRSQVEGKDKKKSGKEKHNEEELQTLRSQVDELQIEVGRVQKEKDNLWKEKEQLQKEQKQLQKENDELKVELKWRRARTYADDITLNPNTAHPNLSISEDKKKFIHEPQPQKVAPTPERFDSTVCVLGSQGFSSEEHYWEVDVKSSMDWDLGVARKSIERKGKLSLSPKEGFWALGLSGRDYWGKTDPWTRVMVQKKPKKIGIYFSYQERQVTFFNVTDMSVLYTFNNCSFSGEVYPFFKNSHKETSMKICSIREDE